VERSQASRLSLIKMGLITLSTHHFDKMLAAARRVAADKSNLALLARTF
jgi:hypothetical protein